MPEMYYTTMSFFGDNFDVKEAILSIRGPNGAIDFNSVIPIPDNVLKSSKSRRGRMATSEVEYHDAFLKDLRWQYKNANLDLPDLSEYNWSILTAYLKLPDEFYNVFGWCDYAWGSRWNATNVEIINDTTIFFGTPLNPPWAVIAKISEINPDVKINVKISSKYSEKEYSSETIFQGGYEFFFHRF